MHTEPMYADADVAALYDLLNPWGPSDDFYLSFVMAAPSVLDVGCGTGRLLHRAREAGHTGRLCGVDPDLAALERARRRAAGVRHPQPPGAGLGGLEPGQPAARRPGEPALPRRRGHRLTGTSDNIVTVARAA